LSRRQFDVFVYDYAACSESELFKCPSTDRCIKNVYVCNGKNECGDWSDELYCSE